MEGGGEGMSEGWGEGHARGEGVKEMTERRKWWRGGSEGNKEPNIASFPGPIRKSERGLVALPYNFCRLCLTNSQSDFRTKPHANVIPSRETKC